MRNFNMETCHIKNEEFITDDSCKHQYQNEWTEVEHTCGGTLDALVGHPVDGFDKTFTTTWKTWERECPCCGSKQVVYVKPVPSRKITFGRTLYVKAIESKAEVKVAKEQNQTTNEFYMD